MDTIHHIDSQANHCLKGEEKVKLYINGTLLDIAESFLRTDVKY